MTLKFKSFYALHTKDLDRDINEFLRENQVTAENLRAWRFDFRANRSGTARNLDTVIFGASFLVEIPDASEDDLVKGVA